MIKGVMRKEGKKGCRNKEKRRKTILTGKEILPRKVKKGRMIKGGRRKKKAKGEVGIKRKFYLAKRFCNRQALVALLEVGE